VLGYEYEFWVDVRHNRNKNGIEEDIVVEEKVIENRKMRTNSRNTPQPD
jgi:hypothetical protein